MTVIDASPQPSDDQHRADVATARAALLDPAMGHVVDMVLRADGDIYEAASAEGHVRFTTSDAGTDWAVDVVEVVGSNPLANQDPGHAAPLEAERANP